MKIALLFLCINIAIVQAARRPICHFLLREYSGAYVEVMRKCPAGGSYCAARVSNSTGLSSLIVDHYEYYCENERNITTNLQVENAPNQGCYPFGPSGTEFVCFCFEDFCNSRENMENIFLSFRHFIVIEPPKRNRNLEGKVLHKNKGLEQFDQALDITRQEVAFGQHKVIQQINSHQQHEVINQQHEIGQIDNQGSLPSIVSPVQQIQPNHQVQLDQQLQPTTSNDINKHHKILNHPGIQHLEQVQIEHNLNEDKVHFVEQQEVQPAIIPVNGKTRHEHNVNHDNTKPIIVSQHQHHKESQQQSQHITDGRSHGLSFIGEANPHPNPFEVNSQFSQQPRSINKVNNKAVEDLLNQPLPRPRVEGTIQKRVPRQAHPNLRPFETKVKTQQVFIIDENSPKIKKTGQK